MQNVNTQGRQLGRLNSMYVRVFKAPLPNALKTSLVATLLSCCLFSQNLLAQCNIAYQSGPNINLSLGFTGNVTLNSNVFVNQVSSPNCPGGTIEIWQDLFATMSFPPTTYTCADVGTVVTVFVTIQGPLARSNAIPFVVTIVDDVPPVVIWPVNVNLPAANGTCARTVSTLTPSVTDNCAGSFAVTWMRTGVTPGSGSNSANGTYNVGVTNVNFTLTDNNTVPPTLYTHTTVVTITDNQPPTYVSTISNATLNANGGPAPNCTADRTWTHPFNSDNCGVVSYTLSLTGATNVFYPNGSFTEGTNITQTFNLGTTTCTYSISDGVNPVVTQVFTVTVNDVTDPVFAPAATTYNAGVGGACEAVISAPSLTRTATDNCDAFVSISFVVNTLSGGPAPFASGNTGDANGTYPVGVYEIVYTAVDNVGNDATHTVTVTVTDNISPTITTCDPITVNLDANGNVTVTGNMFPNDAADNCAVVGYEIKRLLADPWVSSLSFNCTDEGNTYNVRIRAFDAATPPNTSGACVTQVTIEDNLPPEIICQDITVDLNLPGPSPNFTNVDVLPSQVLFSAIDNCTNPLTNIKIRAVADGIPFGSIAIGAPVNFDCTELGPNLVEVRVGDSNGNPNFCTATVTVRDVTPPTPVCNPVVFPLDAVTGEFDLLAPNPATLTTTPAVGLPIPIQDASVLNEPGVTIHTLTIPTSALVGDLNVSLDITHTWVGDLRIELTSPKGTTVTLFDKSCGSADNIMATFDDESSNQHVCSGGSPAMSGTLNAFNPLSAFDGENMQGVWTLTITDFENLDAGTLNAWSLTTTASYLTQLGFGSTDNCYVQWTSNFLQFDCSNVNVAFGGNGPITYTLTVSDNPADGQAQTVTCQSTITVQDVTNPNPVCPSTPINVYLDASGNATVAASVIGAGSIDNCSIADYQIRKTLNDFDYPTLPYPSGFGLFANIQNYTCLDIGLNSVRLWVRDPSNNPGVSPTVPTSVYCHHAINVIDDIDPVAACTPVSVALGTNGEVAVTGFQIGVGSSDNCTGFLFLTREISVDGGMTYNASHTFDCDDIGPNTVFMRVSDTNGNSAACSTTVTIQDNEVPTINCPNDLTIEWVTGIDLSPSAINSTVVIDPIVPGMNDGTATDNCEVTVTWNDGTPVYAPNGCDVDGYVFYVERTWTATDGEGNQSTCVQTITLIDTQAPTFTAPADAVLECPDGYTVADHRCTTVVSPIVPVLISDVLSGTYTSTLNISLPDPTIITDVNVLNLQIAHTWTGDLNISLTSPAGTTVNLINFLCGSNDNVIINLDDEASSGLTCPLSLGNTQQPNGNLSDFIGEDLSGTWTLTIIDIANLDGGALNNWSLNICYVQQEDYATTTSLAGDVTNELDDCDTNPQATFKDYHAYKHFQSHFEGNAYDFSFGAWTYIEEDDNVPTSHDGFVTNISSSSISITGDDDMGTPPTLSNTESNFCITIPTGGPGPYYIAFDWDYVSSNSDAGWDPFGYQINGVFTQLTEGTYCTSNGSVLQNGRALVLVSPGQTFCFSQLSCDGAFGSATTTITNFAFIDGGFPVPAVDCPRSFCIARLWDLEDDCGNDAATQVQLITTEDNTPPVIDLPATMTVLTGAGTCTPFVDLDFSSNIEDGQCSTYDEITVEVNGNPTDDVSGNLAPGTYTFDIDAWDACGNLSSHLLTVNVIDNQTPFAVCFPAIIVQLDNNGLASITPTSINNGSNDNCGIVSMMLSQSNFTTADIGVVPVTLTVFDAQGNSNTCTSQVTVLGGVILDVQDASGPVGGMASPVVTANKFQQVTSFSMDLEIVNPLVAVTTFPTQTGGITGINPALTSGGTFTFVINSASKASISWFSNSPSGLTLADGTPLFSLKTNLVGTLGSSTPVIINNDEIFTVPGGIVNPVPSIGLSGTITILNTSIQYTISGSLKREANCVSPTGDPVNNVTVTLTGTASTPPSPDTNADGSYSFSVAAGSTFTVKPTKDGTTTGLPNPGTWFTGIDIIDVIAVNEHFLGLNLLNSDYKKVAADANKSGTINIADVFIINQLSLSIFPSGLNNTAWRFVDASFGFPPSAPLVVPAFPEDVTVNAISANTVRNFIGVKVGDVNCSANVNLFTNGNGVDERGGLLPFLANDQYFTAGQQITVPFLAKDFAEMKGYQLTVRFDSDALKFQSFQPGSLAGLTEGNLNATAADEGFIATNWFNFEPTDLADGETVFSLTFTALQDGRLSDLLNFNSDFIQAMAVKANGDVFGVNLEFNTATLANEEHSSHFALYQNRPNPFAHVTQIGFRLPQPDRAKLSIFDASGRVLKVVEANFSAGYHQVNVERNELPGSGILFYQLETSTDRAIRKMVLID